MAEGYDMPQHLRPDYYAWLAEVQGNAGQHPPSSSDTPKTPSNVTSESTTTFLQLPLVDGRLPSRSTGSSGDCLPSADLWDIERETRNQSSSSSWHKERSSRLTASNFHSVARRKKQPDEKFLKQLFSTENDIGHLAPLVHGNMHEATAMDDYVAAMHRLGNRDLCAFQVGLCIHPEHNCLGASPDRMVYDPSATPSHGLLEVKCPISLYDHDLTPEEGATQADFFCSLIDGKPTLKMTHRYYTQVQGQLAVTGLEWCDFVVWSGPARLSVERIKFDRVFWEDSTLPALLDFFKVHAVPYWARGKA